MGKLVILSGPSGVGKGPLTQTLEAYCKATGHSFYKYVLYNDRNPREGEKEGEAYRFLTPEEMDKKIQDKNYYWFFVDKTKDKNRQMINTTEFKEKLEKIDFVFLEIILHQVEKVKSIAVKAGCDVKPIFVEPLSPEDYKELGINDEKEKEAALIAVMLSKLINRGTEKRSDQIKRAKRAAKEIKEAKGIMTPFYNPYGEDNARLWGLLRELIKAPGGWDILQRFLQFRDIVFNDDKKRGDENRAHLFVLRKLRKTKNSRLPYLYP